jgi:hypothetical protein
MAIRPERLATARWGDSILKRGFTLVPNLLLTQQSSLGLSSLHCLLLIHLLTYWWESGRNPYPSKAVLARRMGVSERQIQRYVSDLTGMGFIRRRRENIRTKGGRSVVSFDLSGLVEKLRGLEGLDAKASPVAITSDIPDQLAAPGGT